MGAEYNLSNPSVAEEERMIQDRIDAEYAEREAMEEEIINYYIEEASKHGADEIECYIAGWREDVHKDYFTWGEVLDSLIAQEGWVWENHTKTTVELILNHPEIFDK